MSEQQAQVIERIHCNNCLLKTKHSVIAQHICTVTEQTGYYDQFGDEIDMWLRTTHTLFVCRGCESVTLRREQIFSEEEGTEVSFYPPKVSRRMPNWCNELPNEMKQLLDEIYTALHSNSRRLALMGARTIIDMFMLDKLGDKGGFEQKLKCLVDEGYLGSKQKDVLEVALNAGHAATHRNYKPSSEVLNHVIDVVESLVQSYALEKLNSSIKSEVPNRPNRKSV